MAEYDSPALMEIMRAKVDQSGMVHVTHLWTSMRLGWEVSRTTKNPSPSERKSWNMVENDVPAMIATQAKVDQPVMKDIIR
jgi:hypothetical protein